MLLIVALTWCMMGTVEGAAEEAGREGKLMERGRTGHPGEGEEAPGHMEHPDSPMPTVVRPAGQAHAISSGKSDISAAYVEPEQRAGEGILVFKPIILFN